MTNAHTLNHASQMPIEDRDFYFGLMLAAILSAVIVLLA